MDVACPFFSSPNCFTFLRYRNLRFQFFFSFFAGGVARCFTLLADSSLLLLAVRCPLRILWFVVAFLCSFSCFHTCPFINLGVLLFFLLALMSSFYFFWAVLAFSLSFFFFLFSFFFFFFFFFLVGDVLT